MELSKILITLREENKISQYELADRLFVSRELVSKWETGIRRPDLKTLEKIADLFNVDRSALVSDEDLSIDSLSSVVPDFDTLSKQEFTELLNGFLKKCKPRERKLFLMRYYYLKDYSEIADEAGVKENYARSVLCRTRKKLEKYIKENRHE